MSQAGQTDIDPAPASVQIGFNVPAFYMNGYNNTASVIDVTTLATWNNKPQAFLTMPLTVAKTYALNLLELVEAIESQTSRKVFTIQELTRPQEQSPPGASS